MVELRWQEQVGEKERRTEVGAGWEKSPGKPKEGPSPALPIHLLRTQYLGSWLQGWHKVFDHFGFRDCDSAHDKEDQERVVAGMRPAHLQNKPPPVSGGCIGAGTARLGASSLALPRDQGCHPPAQVR